MHIHRMSCPFFGKMTGSAVLQNLNLSVHSLCDSLAFVYVYILHQISCTESRVHRFFCQSAQVDKKRCNVCYHCLSVCWRDISAQIGLLETANTYAS